LPVVAIAATGSRKRM